MLFFRKYNVTLDASTPGSTKVRISHLKRDGSGFCTSSDWTPAAGDVKVSKDGGAEANIGALPAYANGQWEYVLSAAELQAKVTRVRVADDAVELAEFTVETFGNASAMWAGDFTAASAAQTGDAFARLGAPAGASVSADVAALNTKLGTPATGTVAGAIAEVKADTASLLASLAEKFLGMTSLAAWLRTIAGASTDTTALAEIEAGGGDFGAGSTLVERGAAFAATPGDASSASADAATAATQAAAAATSAASADTKADAISAALAALSTAVADVKADTASLLASLAEKFLGMTSLAAWLRTIAGASVDATALAELNEGLGEFDPASDSLASLAEELAEVLAAVQAIDPPSASEILAALEGGGTKLTALHGTLASSGVFASAAFAQLTVSGGFGADDRTKLTELAAILAESGVLSAASLANLPLHADAATAAEQAEILAAVLALTLNAGGGANRVEFQVLGSDGEAVAGAVVTLRKSGSPAERFTQITDASGKVVFALESGDWLRSIYKPGLAHTPDTLTVAGDVPSGADPVPTVAMIAAATSPPSEPGLVTARIRLVGGTGTATIRLKAPPEGSGGGFNSRARAASPASGVCYWANCAPGGEYEIKLGSSSSWYPRTFTIPADQVTDFDINNVLGILADE